MALTLAGRNSDGTTKAVRYTPCKDSDNDVKSPAMDGHVTSSNAGHWSSSSADTNDGRLPLDKRNNGPPSSQLLTNGPRSLSMPETASANCKSTTLRPQATGAPLATPTPTPSPSTERTKLLHSNTVPASPDHYPHDDHQKLQQQQPEYPSPWQQLRPHKPSSSLPGDGTQSDGECGKRQRAGGGVKDVAYTNKSFADHPPSVIQATSRDVRRQRRKEIKQKFGDRRKSHFNVDASNMASNARDDNSRCHKWTFIFDPAGRLSYWWSMVVSCAFIYNLWVIIYRFVFDEINPSTNMIFWFTLDYLADLIYVLDIVFHFRTGYLDDGVLQTDLTKLRIHYMNSMTFYVDCLCLLPLDFLYLSVGFRSLFRCFRLVKIYRFWAFLDRTERHTNHPNVVRTLALLHYLFCIYHWNACIMHLVIINVLNKGSSMWSEAPPSEHGVFAQYLHALYWSTMALTRSVGDPPPTTSAECVVAVVQCVLGVLLFAAILGHVANIVTSVSAGRKDFQANLDRLKTYMRMRRVPMKLQDKVIKWFDYLWLTKKSMEEDRTLGLLPDKLKAEIALHVHLDTLKRVEIFQNTDAGFLRDLVLRLKPVLFSPGDFVCTKGEVGKEMYVVSRGRLQVVGDNGKTVLAILRPGSYFGEISVLNMGNAGNRRTASVKSVGYSDLFCLSKKDLWDVLKDYPAARVKLEAIAVKRLVQFEKAPLAKIALPRSRSTPGLVESVGKVPLELMPVKRHSVAPPNSVPTVKRLDVGDTQRADSQPGSPAVVARTVPVGVCSPSADRTAVAAHFPHGIVYSATMSSLTSYVADSVTTPLSPSGVAADDVMMYHVTTSPQRLADVNVSALGSSSGGSSRIMSMPATPSRDIPVPSDFRSSTGAPTLVYAPPSLQPNHPSYPTTPTLVYPSTPIMGYSPQPTGDRGSAFVSICRPSSPLPMQWQPVGYAYRSPSPYPQAQYVQQAAGGPVIPNRLPLPSYGGVIHALPQQAAGGADGGGGGGGSNGNGAFLNVVGPQHHLLHPPVSSSSLSPNLTISYGSMTPSPEPYGSSPTVVVVAEGQDQLLHEVDRLTQRLQTLEQENASLGAKLSRQRWEVDSRLADIEMHMCGSCSADSTGSGGSDVINSVSHVPPAAAPSIGVVSKETIM